MPADQTSSPDQGAEKAFGVQKKEIYLLGTQSTSRQPALGRGVGKVVGRL